MPCLYTILYSAQWEQWVWTWSETKTIGLAIGFTEISILSLFKTAWFPALHKIHFMLSKWAKWASKQWKLLFFCLKTDFLSFFVYVLCYIFWFSRSVSNMLSTTFNWAKWAKWVGLIQGQELNISLWNLFLWIQCPRIGERDRNSYFYHQMLFLEVILLSTLSKMSNFMAKTSQFCLGTHIIGFSTFQLG